MISILIGSFREHVLDKLAISNPHAVIIPNLTISPPQANSSLYGKSSILDRLRDLKGVECIISTNCATLVDVALPEEIYICQEIASSDYDAICLIDIPEYPAFHEAYCVGIQSISEILVAKGIWSL